MCVVLGAKTDKPACKDNNDQIGNHPVSTVSTSGVGMFVIPHTMSLTIFSSRMNIKKKGQTKLCIEAM